MLVLPTNLQHAILEYRPVLQHGCVIVVAHFTSCRDVCSSPPNNAATWGLCPTVRVGCDAVRAVVVVVGKVDDGDQQLPQVTTVKCTSLELHNNSQVSRHVGFALAVIIP